ncbi:hypothetical protein N0V83_003703 [Neocucurbitaria cava]|uniref:Uncharacterized protein n=1 Tax=Neocucurbitaria cava TaxID=798079 RepID=A0A9W9CNW3_9PLEO|nr:hypothetical protein N0V83_003703 [Neocucurbitaria cava]
MPNPKIYASIDVEYQPCTGGQAPETSSNVTQHFQEFSRLELPRLVRRTLESVIEQEAQPLEDKLKERLVDIVKECQTQLVNMFQATVGGGPAAMMALTHPPPPPPEATTQQSGGGSGCDEDAAFELFPGFDSSLPVRIIAPAPAPAPAPAAPNEQPFPELMGGRGGTTSSKDFNINNDFQPTYQQPPSPRQTSSGSDSPDSFEYDSANWTTVSTNFIIPPPPPPPPTIYVRHDDVTMMTQNVTTATATDIAAGASNEYVHVGLGGYYDIFQEQERASFVGELSDDSLDAEFDPVAAWAFVDALPAADASSELTMTELGSGWSGWSV